MGIPVGISHTRYRLIYRHVADNISPYRLKHDAIKKKINIPSRFFMKNDMLASITVYGSVFKALHA